MTTATLAQLRQQIEALPRRRRTHWRDGSAEVINIVDLPAVLALVDRLEAPLVRQAQAAILRETADTIPEFPDAELRMAIRDWLLACAARIVYVAAAQGDVSWLLALVQRQAQALAEVTAQRDEYWDDLCETTRGVGLIPMALYDEAMARAHRAEAERDAELARRG